MTLRELLDSYWDGSDLLAGAIEAWAYGEERECDDRAHGDGRAWPVGGCRSCHGTGKVKTPGLVERLCNDDVRWNRRLYITTDALRKELG